ncbi:hypothetical protein GCM10009123_14190 [Kangiella japonica]|uniref:Uncharacterized protein n=1 Tax=Kangiella japonica TaxID=647384 RepID=A0ABP3CJS6_9GAMM
MTDATWSAISAISAAVAAIIALITIGISLYNDSKRRQQNELKESMALYASLLLVDRTMDYVIRNPSKDAISKVEASLVDLLSVIASSNTVVSIASSLPTDAEKCLSWIDELDFNNFNDFKESIKQKQFSDYELKFRKIKNELEDKLNITHS